MNATLRTTRLNGDRITTDLIVTSISFPLELQMDSAQIKKAMAHRPIRFEERSIDFSVDHSHRYGNFGTLVSRVREHHRYCISDASPHPDPMLFTYIPRGWVFRGFVEQIQAGKERHQAKYTHDLKLLIVGEPSNWSHTTLHSRLTPLMREEGEPMIDRSAMDVNDWMVFEEEEG